MLNIHVYKKTYLMPESWNELTGRQLVQMAHILMQPDYSYKDRLLLLKICLGMKDKNFINWAYLPKYLSDSLFWRKVEVLLFLNDHVHLVDFLLKENNLTKQLLPRLVVWTCSKCLYGPSDNFENLRMDEFCYSEYHFLEYKKTGSRDALVRLVATLYRPKKWLYNTTINKDGDPRIPFNEHVIAANARCIQHLSDAELKAVLIWYMGCRAALVTLFPKVFSGKDTDGESFGLFSLITGVAEDGVMGDFDKVNSKLVHTILLRLTELIIRAEKIEEDLKAIK